MQVEGEAKAMDHLCPACGSELITGLKPWHFECSGCDYEGSDLQPHILEQADGGDLDEGSRETGLVALRKANFHRLVQRLNEVVPKGSVRPRLLDVGCAHGWFLEAAGSDYEPHGIEPDVAVAQATRARGHQVRSGFFPEALDATEQFDVIVFNDVLEHIPDINGTLEACFERLNPDGWLVVNAPSRRGFLYRLSRVLTRVGLPGSFERMWQLGFPSPHVHYLDTATLEAMARRHGFVLESRMALPSVAVRGLYSRIRYSRDVSLAKAVTLTAAVTMASPALAMLPPDIEVWFFRRPG